MHLILRVNLICLTISLTIPNGHNRCRTECDAPISHSMVGIISRSLLHNLWTMVGMAMVGWQGHKHHSGMSRVVELMVGAVPWFSRIQRGSLVVVHVGRAVGKWCHVLLWVCSMGEWYRLGCAIVTRV